MPKSTPVGKLTEALLRKHPVWEFTNEDGSDEMSVRPVKKLPVISGDGRLFGSEIRFADGSVAFGLIGNLSLTDKEQNAHFRTLTVFLKGKAHGVSRYHDFDFEKRGPTALAKQIGKKPGEIFPISYDLSAVAKGAKDCVAGVILAEPKKKLTRQALIAAAVG